MALDEADALQRTKGRGEQIDLILLEQCNQSLEEAISIRQQIRQVAEPSHHTSIVVMAERYGVELEGNNVYVKESTYVTHLEDRQQLKGLLYQIYPVE